MTGQISADEGALRRGVTALDTAGASIAGSAGRVRGAFDELSGFWRGEAASAYSALMAEWDADMRHLQAILTSLKEALGATERDQDATEERHSAVIGDLSGLMAGAK